MRSSPRLAALARWRVPPDPVAGVIGLLVALLASAAAMPATRPAPHPQEVVVDSGKGAHAVDAIIEAESGAGDWEIIEEAGVRAIRARAGGAMSYRVKFAHPGIYYVHLRCHHAGGTKDAAGVMQKGESTNDAFVTLGGAPLYAADGVTRPEGMRCHSGEFRWWSLPKGPGAHTPGAIKDRPVHAYIPRAGTYEIVIRYRSPGLVIDQLALTTTMHYPSPAVH